MQFVITALDHTDDGASQRRLDVRAAHLDRVHALTEGRILSGGALLDDAGTMIGSSMHVEFPTRESLDAWLGGDPYVTGDVWDEIEIRPFRQAVSSPSADHQ